MTSASSAAGPIQVVMAADRNYLLPLAAATASLAAAHPHGDVHLHIVATGLDSRDRHRVEEGAPSLEITWLAPPTVELEALPLRNPRLTRTTLVRLYLPGLMPGVDRVLYLDTDLVVVDSLTELWRQQLDGCLVGAVRDVWAFVGCVPGWPELGLPPHDPYFNAGVLLIPLDRWRAEGVAQAAIRLLEERHFAWDDQDVLNVVLADSWLELSRRWNLGAADASGASLAWALATDDVRVAVERPAIVHYVGDKPWHGYRNHPLWECWFMALDRTAWAGWRPSSRLDSAVSRARALRDHYRRWRASAKGM